MPSRHPILYDVQRWRRNRAILLGPATAFIALSLVIGAKRPQDASTSVLYTAMGAFLYALAISLWLRQRFSYLAVSGGVLLVRSMPLSQRVPLEHVRRARAASMRSVYNRPERRRLLPRRGLLSARVDWLEREAIVLRLDPAVDAVRLARLLGRRCLVGGDVVVPVAEPAVLAADIEAARPAPEVQRRSRRRR